MSQLLKSGMGKRFARGLETTLLAVGLTLLAVFLAFRVYSSIASRSALKQFAELSAQKSAGGGIQTQPLLPAAEAGAAPDAPEPADKQTQAAESGAPMAVLTIPKIALKVPVFDGTEESTLSRGVGRIIGTSKPGQEGNIGIAGHRDGFFLGLKDIRIGDRIELETLNQRNVFVVDTVKIVLPDDVGVLEPKGHTMLTLVTCYPFYYIGHAPKRYIVQASQANPDLPSGTGVSKSKARKINSQEAMK